MGQSTCKTKKLQNSICGCTVNRTLKREDDDGMEQACCPRGVETRKREIPSSSVQVRVRCYQRQSTLRLIWSHALVGCSNILDHIERQAIDEYASLGLHHDAVHIGEVGPFEW
jgi:hypothetical protein